MGIVRIFVVESGNTEIFDYLNNEQREIDNIEPRTLNIKMNINEINIAITSISEKFRCPVSVTFVDEQYQIKYYYTDEGKSEFTFLNQLRATEGINFINSNWDEYLPHFEYIEEEDHYIFISSKPFLNEYEMANFLSIPLYSNCYFKWGADNILQVEEAKAYYNIFSKILRNNQFDSLGSAVEVDPTSINWIVEHGVRQVQGLIKCGCLRKERFIQSKVDYWITNPYSIFSKGVIIETGLIPKPHPDVIESNILKGLTILEQFNEDASYRYRITDFMCRILAKYGLEFGKLTTINNNPHIVNFDFLL